MSKKIWIIVLLLLGAAVLWGFRRYKQDKPDILSGSIETRDVEVGSLVGGRVLKVDVEEGDRVRKGQEIVKLDSALLDLQILEQQAAIAEAKANLTRTEKGPRTEELARAKLDWQNAERERKRLENLSHQGIIGRQQYDDAATKAATALEAYRELQRGSRPEDISAAQAALDREQGQLAYLERQRQETIVSSPADGVIESIDLRPGDLVTANQSVAKILEPDQLWVRVYVPEPKLGEVRLGQSVKVFIDTYPDRPFAGKVVDIKEQGEYTPRNIQTLDQRSDQVFGVKVAIQPSPELKPGMAATVRLY